MSNSTSSSVRKSITLESGVRNVVSVEQGSHYVLKGAEGAFWDECLAVRSGDDLIVRFADGTVLVLDGFFAVGAAVELPAENGTYQVLDAEAYGDTGSAVVHAVGEASTLSSLAAYDSAIADYVEAVLSAGESLPTAGGYAGGVENLFGVLGAAGGLGLAAAGAGGGGGSSGSFAPGQVNPGQSGVVVDGYISGASVSRANGSGNTVRTDNQGRFDGLTGTGDIVVTGGMDMSTEQPFTGQLRAPSDATVITPLTTLVVELEEQGQARDAAIARVKAAFDLNDGFDLLNQDPVAQANEGNADALQVLKAGVQVATLLQAATGTEAGFEAGAKALADKVNVAGFDSTVFFTDRHELQSLVDDIVGSLPGTDVNSDFDATSAALQFVDMAKAQNATELADTQAIALIEQAPDRFNVPVGGEVPIARLTVTPGSTIATEAEAIEGAVRVLGVEGAIVTVTFTGPGGEVVKLLTGDGKAQHVSLTEADLAELGEGQITVSATQTLDGVRQTGAPAIRGFTLDTIAPEAPALALVEDTGTFAGITSNGQVNVTDLEEDATWEYSLDDGNTWTAGAGTSIAASAFGADGSKSVTVRQTDVAGNVSQASAALAFTLDTAAPTVSLANSSAGDLVNLVEATAKAGVTSVTAENGTTWAATLTGTAGTVTKMGSGIGSAQAVPLQAADITTLGQGAVTVSVTATDAAGNVATASTGRNFTLDTTAPMAPSLLLASDSGSGDSDGITNNGVVKVTGLEEDATWEYSLDRGNTWTSGTGTSIAASVFGSDGTKSVTVRQTDVAGNTSTVSTALSFTLDTAAPTVSLANSSAGDLVNLVEATAEAGVTSVTAENGTTWAVTLTGTAGTVTKMGSGTGSAQAVPLQAADITTLGQGAVTVSVTATDAAGNAATTSTGGNFTLDTAAPAPPGLALAVDTGADGSDSVTNNGQVNVMGLEQGATWEYKVADGEWTAGEGTSFTVTGDGTKSVTVRQTDVAGNVSQASAALEFTLDTAAPTVSLANSSAGDLVNLVEATAKAGVTSVTAENGTTWAATLTGTAGTVTKMGSGTGSAQAVPLQAADITTLGQGAVTVSVTATDAAGNAATTSTGGNFTLDTVAPAAPGLALAVDTGADGSDSVTNNGQVNVMGLEQGATWEYKVADGEWTAGEGTSFTVTGDGAKSVTVRQTDVAGNVSQASSVLKFTLDTTAPAAPGLALATDSGSSDSDGMTNDGTVNVTGLELGATWEYSLDDGNIWTAGTGTSIAASAFGADGAKSVTVRQTDVVGNVSQASSVLKFTLDTVAPAVPSIHTVAGDDFVSASENTNLIITGTGEPNATLVLANSGSPAISTVVDSNGDWSVTVEDAAAVFGQGKVTLSVTQTNLSGNTSEPATRDIAFLMVFENWAHSNGDGSNRAPTLADYEAAGFSTVNSDNLSAVNASLAASSREQASTADGLNVIVNTGVIASMALLADGMAAGGHERFISVEGEVMRLHEFKEVGITGFNVGQNLFVDYLIVGGGGGGAGRDIGGGGGAGGVLTANDSLFAQGMYAITVGRGGAGGVDANNRRTGAVGENSAITNGDQSIDITAFGGGGGAGWGSAAARSGGSGGGGDGITNINTVGAGTAGQGFDGGIGVASSNAAYGGGGGGGADQSGRTAVQGRHGGSGILVNITGHDFHYGGGGGGAAHRNSTGQNLLGQGGLGGGGHATNDGGLLSNGQANTGGGGGASRNTGRAGGAGGSGVVITRYDTGIDEDAARSMLEGIYTQVTGNRVKLFDDLSLYFNLILDAKLTDQVLSIEEMVAAIKLVKLLDEPIAVNGIINAAERAAGVVLTGTTAPGKAVTIATGTGSPITTTSDASNGVWSITLPAANLPTGHNMPLTLTVSSEDTQGNPVSMTRQVIVDTVPPDAPSLILGAGLEDGASTADATSSSGVVTVIGERGSRIDVTFTHGLNTIKKTVIGNGGTSVAVTLTENDLSALGDGNISVSAQATDKAGNTSASSEATFALDTVAPTLLISNSNTGIATGPVTLTYSFSETVKGFDASNLSVVGGMISEFHSTNGKDFTLTIIPSEVSEGHNRIQISLNTKGLTDQAGNEVEPVDDYIQELDAQVWQANLLSSRARVDAWHAGNFNVQEAPSAQDYINTGYTATLRFGNGQVKRGFGFSGDQANAGQDISLSWGDQSVTTKADTNGMWSASFFAVDTRLGPSAPTGLDTLSVYTTLSGGERRLISEQKVLLDLEAPEVIHTTASSLEVASNQSISVDFYFSEMPATLNKSHFFASGATVQSITQDGVKATVSLQIDDSAHASQVLVGLKASSWTDLAGNQAPLDLAADSVLRLSKLGLGDDSLLTNPLQPMTESFHLRAGAGMQLDLRDASQDLNNDLWSVLIDLPTHVSLSHGFFDDAANAWRVSGTDLHQLSMNSTRNVAQDVVLDLQYQERSSSNADWRTQSSSAVVGRFLPFIEPRGISDDPHNFHRVIEAWSDGLRSYAGGGVLINIKEANGIIIPTQAQIEHGRMILGVSSNWYKWANEHSLRVAFSAGGSIDGARRGVAYDSYITWINSGGPLAETDIINRSVGAGKTFGRGWFNLDGGQALRGGLGALMFNSAGNDWDPISSENRSSKEADTIAVASINNDTGAPLFNWGDGVFISAVGSGGTSFASPTAAGVGALILEANSGLGFRDAADILAYSARYMRSNTGALRLTGYTLNQANSLNGAGLHYNERGGFGIVDAQAAVALARDWLVPSVLKPRTAFETAGDTSSKWLHSIPASDNTSYSVSSSANTETVLGLNVTQDIRVETLQFLANIVAPDISKLRITLVSPSGTESRVMIQSDLASANGLVRLTSERFRGESSLGEWKAVIFNAEDIGSTATVSSFRLDIYGAEANIHQRYVYTDEWEVTYNQIADDATRSKMMWLSANNSGEDSVYMSAMNSNIRSLLGRYGSLEIFGEKIGLINAASVRNVFGGRGEDWLLGHNQGNSILHGNDGGDRIVARGKENIIDGGDGPDWIWFSQHDEVMGGEGADKFIFNRLLWMPTHIEDVQSVISDFEASSDHIFRFDPFSHRYQYGRVQADEPLQWIDVKDSSLVAEFEEMRHLAHTPRVSGVNISEEHIEIEFDQSLQSLGAEWQVQNQVPASPPLRHFDRVQLRVDSKAPIIEVKLPNPDNLTNEFGHSFSGTTLLFSEEEDVTIDASQIDGGAYIWALDNGAALIGGSGNDVLVSNTGVGGGIKTGGQGADLFVWQAVEELRVGSISTVTDFNRADGDQLDISNIFNFLDVDSEIDEFFKIDIENDDVYLRFDIDRSGSFASVYSIHLENAFLNQSIMMEDSLSSLYLNQTIMI